MNDFESTSTSPAGAGAHNGLQRLLRWLREESAHERYLAAATDHADLERRQRALEHQSMGPAFVTFNH
jgi:hypothetical protein